MVERPAPLRCDVAKPCRKHGSWRRSRVISPTAVGLWRDVRLHGSASDMRKWFAAPRMPQHPGALTRLTPPFLLLDPAQQPERVLAAWLPFALQPLGDLGQWQAEGSGKP